MQESTMTPLEIDDEQDARRTRRARTTSIGSWVIMLLVVALLLCLRLPQFTAIAADAVSGAEIDLDDPALASTAVTIGTVAAVILHLLLLSVLAVLAVLLERYLGPRAWGARSLGTRDAKLRLGVAGLTFAVIVLGQQGAALALGVASIPRSWPLWVAAAVVALVAPLVYPEARSSARRYGSALIASGGIAVLLCVG